MTLNHRREENKVGDKKKVVQMLGQLTSMLRTIVYAMMKRWAERPRKQGFLRELGSMMNHYHRIR